MARARRGSDAGRAAIITRPCGGPRSMGAVPTPEPRDGDLTSNGAVARELRLRSEGWGHRIRSPDRRAARGRRHARRKEPADRADKVTAPASRNGCPKQDPRVRSTSCLPRMDAKPAARAREARGRRGLPGLFSSGGDQPGSDGRSTSLQRRWRARRAPRGGWGGAEEGCRFQKNFVRTTGGGGAT